MTAATDEREAFDAGQLSPLGQCWVEASASHYCTGMLCAKWKRSPLS